MRKVTLHYVSSHKVANELVDKLAKLSDTGGRQCFDTDLCPISSRPGRKVVRINFLPDMYAKLRPEFGAPNTDMLSGFVRGVLSAKR